MFSLPLSSSLSHSLSLHNQAVWQAEPCWISLFYLHCASGWHCVLDLGCSQVYVRVCVCVCVRVCLLANVIMLQFMNLKLAWLYVPQSATHKFPPS